MLLPPIYEKWVEEKNPPVNWNSDAYYLRVVDIALNGGSPLIKSRSLSTIMNEIAKRLS